MAAMTTTTPTEPVEPLGPEHDPEHELWHRVAHALRDIAHPVHLGEHLLDELDHLGGRAADGDGPVSRARERQVWDWIDHLNPRRVIDRLAAIGGRFIDALDGLGNRTRAELGIREWTGPVNRLPRGTMLVVGAIGTLVVLFVWTAMQSEGQGNDWMTDPGAGLAAGVAAPTGMPGTSSASGSAAGAPSTGTSSSGGGAAGGSAPGTTGTSSSAATSSVPAMPMAAGMPMAAAGAVGAGVAAGGGTSASSPAGAAVQSVTLAVDPPPLGGVVGSDGQVHDAFVPGTFTMKAGSTVEVTVVNYDAMPHTWTSPTLGVNASIPAGTSASPSRTTFTIHPTTAGTFSWYCATPCDPWSMVHDGYMRGTVTVTS